MNVDGTLGYRFLLYKCFKGGEMSSSISQDFKMGSLLKFAFPSMIMMMFMSLYAIVDGVFISRYVGSDALSASNIVFPVITIVIAVGVMLATGGSAVVARKMGEGNIIEARKDFTMLTILGFSFGVVVLVVGNIWIEPIVKLLGATPRLLSDCISYLSVLLYFTPLYMLQMLFQTFLVTAGRPNLGLGATIAGGVANIVLDYIFMGPMNLGVLGAAFATGIGQAIPAIIGFIYFFFCKEELYFVTPQFHKKVLKETCFNGSSEMVSNLATSVVTFLFNIIMLKMKGEEGVAAITIALYGQFLFNSLYMGYSMGVAPVISFNYGKKNQKLLKNVVKICFGFITLSSILILSLSLLTNQFVVEIFSQKGSKTYEIAVAGCFLFSFNYLFSGINIFSSSMFTALSNGKISAIISFMRTFVFLILSILLLPIFIGELGVWLSVPVAEFFTIFIAIGFILYNRKKYNY